MRFRTERMPTQVFRLFVLSVILFAPAGGISFSQQREHPQQMRPPSQSITDPLPAPSILVSPDEDYRIGPADVIEIQIEDAPELSNTWRVSANGTVSMPYLDSVKAEGKSPVELEKFIADGLRGRYLKDPQVHVLVKQINSRSFFIQGSVRRPGVYQIEGRPSLLKLITVAGGLADSHGSTAFIISEKKPKRDEGAETVDAAPAKEILQTSGQRSDGKIENADAGADYDLKTVNISGLLRGRFNQNMYLDPGDIVNIPPLDVFFVAGEVNAPGSFPLKEGTTLRQAVSLAQGTTFNAAGSEGVIFREDLATGQRNEIKVDIGEVMRGKKEDIQIQANDIIIVPNSRFKSVGNALLRAFGLGTAQRGPYRY